MKTSAIVLLGALGTVIALMAAFIIFVGTVI